MTRQDGRTCGSPAGRRGLRLPSVAGVWLGSRRRGDPGVVGADDPRGEHRRPAGGCRVRRPRPGPLRRADHPRLRRGGRARQGLPVERAAEDLAGAVDHLVGLPAVTSSTVGAIGFCMGGGFVFALAARRPDLVSAAVPFYGLPRDGSVVPRIRAAVQGHFGLEDRGIPVERVRSVFAVLDERPEPALGTAVPVPGRSCIPQRREPHWHVRPRVRGASVVAGGPVPHAARPLASRLTEPCP